MNGTYIDIHNMCIYIHMYIYIYIYVRHLLGYLCETSIRISTIRELDEQTKQVKILYVQSATSGDSLF